MYHLCCNTTAVNTPEHASFFWHVTVIPLGGIAEAKDALHAGFDFLSFNPSLTLFLRGGHAAYREPYLFVTHFNSLEVIEIQARSSVG